MFPKRNIYVISSIGEDKSIDSLKPKRINVMHSQFMFDDFTAEDFKDSLVIADDVDVFPTKIKKKVLSIIIVFFRLEDISMLVFALLHTIRQTGRKLNY